MTSFKKPNYVNTKQCKMIEENLKIKNVKEFEVMNDIHNKNNVNNNQKGKYKLKNNTKKCSKVKNDWSLNETLL